MCQKNCPFKEVASGVLLVLGVAHCRPPALEQEMLAEVSLYRNQKCGVVDRRVFSR